MGLFDKKFCDVCGEKIGLLGNRKLEDGNLCKNCASKLSPFFSERKHSTIEEIKRQLEYREQNKKALDGFFPTVIIGNNTKVYISVPNRNFVVSDRSDWKKFNPDIIDFSQVSNISTAIKENRTELFYKDDEGRNKSYVPPRYDVEYEFNITMHISSPWFSEIKFELSGFSSRPDSPYTDLYREYERQAHQLTDIIMNGGHNNAGGTMNGAVNSGMNGSMNGAVAGTAFAAQNGSFTRNAQPNGAFSNGQGSVVVGGFSQGAATAPSAPLNGRPSDGDGWVCPSCNAATTGKFCQNCGTQKARPIEFCPSCGTRFENPENPPKFCPSCGNAVK